MQFMIIFHKHARVESKIDIVSRAPQIRSNNNQSISPAQIPTELLQFSSIFEINE